MKLPDILEADRLDEAAALVNKYYTKLYRHGLPQTGSRFDDWDGGGDRVGVVNSLTANDVLAVSFLSVQVPASAAIGLLEANTREVTGLLEKIPADLDLASVSLHDYERLLGPNSPASALWQLLRGSENTRWGIGPTTASKIMARKRPRLIPIFDSVVGPLMGHPTAKGQWETWHAALTDDSGLPARLQAIKKKSGIEQGICDLRTMDVILWMHGKELGMVLSDDNDDRLVGNSTP
ncbi:DUF6308 family protein [Paenarthrobacter sp. NPDC091669]|uniref:DUF6308 family protein n=1 Tax=Paenarthrobacter sp. NPDC091669 TaxID=3364384 RepID=UPI00381EE9D6